MLNAKDQIDLREEDLSRCLRTVPMQSQHISQQYVRSNYTTRLPQDVAQYVDKYFSRTKAILEAEGINPIVRAQVFIRKGPGVVAGITDALHLLKEKSSFFTHGGKAFAVEEGGLYQPKDTVLMLEGALQDFVELETLYLGILSRAVTARNDGIHTVDLHSVTERMHAVVQAAEGRPVIYFGARHWHWDEDAAIGAAAIRGGALGASTDAGAMTLGVPGQGTIPHVLENAFAYIHGKDHAVVASTAAFDRVIDTHIARIALVDYNNKEIDDAIAVAQQLGNALYGVRVDTCGENVMQGALASFDPAVTQAWRSQGLPLVSHNHPHAKYWVGHGVSITGVYALRKALQHAGFPDVRIILTSGFGDVEKVKAFFFAEKLLGVKLFDQLGVGELYPSRAATMDIVSVQDADGVWSPLSKVGRGYRPNTNLKEIIFI
jgi:nicotinate phosphoribosyltransferase